MCVCMCLHAEETGFFPLPLTPSFHRPRELALMMRAYRRREKRHSQIRTSKKSRELKKENRRPVLRNSTHDEDNTLLTALPNA